MIIVKKLALSLGLAFLAACSTDKVAGPEIDANTVTFNDFEGGGGWSSDPAHNNSGLVVKGRAHSGQYAIIVDKDHEYSLTFDLPLGQVSTHKFKTLHLEAWVFLASPQSTATLGLQVLEPDASKQIYGDDIKFRDTVKKYKEWVFVSKDFTLPDNITALQHLRIFAWRADATDEALVDDVKLSLKED